MFGFVWGVVVFVICVVVFWFFGLLVFEIWGLGRFWVLFGFVFFVLWGVFLEFWGLGRFIGFGVLVGLGGSGSFLCLDFCLCVYVDILVSHVYVCVCVCVFQWLSSYNNAHTAHERSTSRFACCVTATHSTTACVRAGWVACFGDAR